MDAVGRYAVARERRARPHCGRTGDGAGGRVVERSGVRREIARSPCGEREAVIVLELLAVAIALPVGHEEDFIAPDRAAQRVSVLIPLERGFRQRRLSLRKCVTPRVEGVVAVELEHGSV